MACGRCLVTALAASVVLVGAWCLYGVTHVAEVAFRNDSGRVLRAVRVDAYQYEASPERRSAETTDLLPGASLVLSGGWSSYELSLRQVTVDGVALLSSAVDNHYWARFDTGPAARSLLAIDQDLRLRTIVQARSAGSALPCLCPDGNAGRRGSSACPISIHCDLDAPRASASSRPR